MKLSFLIPTYNRLETVKEQIDFLYSLPVISDVDLEIVVGDNSDNNETEKYIQSNCFNNLIYYKNEENIGYGRNVIKCFENSTGDYIWLLGDKNYFEDTDYVEVVGLIKRNFDAVLIADDKESNYDFVYDDIDKLVADFGFRFSNLICSVLNKDCLKTLNKCYKYSDYNFSHIAVMLEYLSSLESINVTWYKKNIYRLRNVNMPYWNNSVFKVFAHDWFYTIMSLPNNISVKSKIICLKGQDSREHIFSPYAILKYRLYSYRRYSIRDLKDNREYIELTSFSSYWKVYFAIVLPIGFLKYALRLPVIRSVVRI